MYYPYLRAKQYELKALTEFSAEHKGQASIVPILEPVKQQINTLNTAIEEMVENGMMLALILNPKDGDFKHATVQFDPWSQLEKLDTFRGKWIPAFLYTKRYASEIASAVAERHLDNVMIIFRSCMDMEDADVQKLLENDSVKYVVNAFGPTVSRRLRKELTAKGKKVIRLDDCFKSKTRNADYALEDDEFFSEEPFFFSEEEKLDGYSDYTTLPSEYIEGGMLPYALAIHLSYRKNEDQIFVHHFVSDNNKTNTDMRGKFREAASKVAPFFANKDKNDAVLELIDKANDPDGYPGLGYLKKLSVKNHLEVILSINQPSLQ